METLVYRIAVFRLSEAGRRASKLNRPAEYDALSCDGPCRIILLHRNNERHISRKRFQGIWRFPARWDCGPYAD